MFRLKDRNDNDMCLAPTHEEEITQLVANEVSSYRQLPLRLYQIGILYISSPCLMCGILIQHLREEVQKRAESKDGLIESTGVCDERSLHV